MTTTLRTATTEATTRAQAIVDRVNTGLFIDGDWVDAASGRTTDVINPATEQVLTTIADGGAPDAQRAIDVAAARQDDWARTPPRERGEILRRAYELIIARQDDLATLMTVEMGKPLAEARGEVTYGADFFRWFAEEAVRIGGDMRLSGDGKTHIFVSRQPVGPSVLVTPWNFPLAMGTRKIGPAIAAGCTMVFKPAQLTPLTSFALVEILAEAGLPPGVLNVVCTSTAGEVVGSWLASGKARKISFTGSTEVGVRLLEQAAQRVLRSSMELGGNAPFIVCEDADLDAALEGAMVAKMRNMGEACTAANRMFVHRSLHDEFGARLAEQMASLQVGDGLADDVQVGPLVEAKALEKVTELVGDAVEHGAEVASGGTRPDGRGFFWEPTVLTDVDPHSRLMAEEIFGPVAPLVPYDDEDEMIRIANDTPWGLMGYVYTTSIERAFRLGERLESGMIGLNTGLVSNPQAPFGGVKASGLGREGGTFGMEEFLEVKYLALPRT